MAKAIDIGTCFVVGAHKEGGKDVFTIERNAFFLMPMEEFADEMLTRAGAFFLRKDKNIYVMGEDALKFSVVAGNREDYHRPMAKGVLNPGEEEAVAMIEAMIEAILGEPSHTGELVAATCPAEPVEGDLDTTYHRMVLERLLAKLGYKVHIISEAMAVIYSENPTVKSDGLTIPFTGLGISFGAGMVNLAMACRAKKILDFSCSRGGDWVDSHAARASGVPVSKVTSLKEKNLDFNNIDSNDRVAVALEIYYEDLIRYVLDNLNRQLKHTGTSIDDPVDLVIAGGLAKPAGFLDKFKQILSESDLDIEIGHVRLAEDLITSAASGALVTAESLSSSK